MIEIVSSIGDFMQINVSEILAYFTSESSELQHYRFMTGVF
jgi:hypothetical protein